MKKLKESVGKYLQALDDVNDRRVFWQESAKKTIKERLEFLKKI